MRKSMPEVVEELQRKVEERTGLARARRRVDWRRHTAGGQGKSGAKPARSRHCDRAKRDAASAGSATGDATASPGRRGVESRKPGDLSSGQPYQPSRKGWLTWLIPASPARRRIAAVGRVVLLAARGGARPTPRASTSGSSSTGGKTLAEHRQYTGTVDDQDRSAAPTASARGPAAAATRRGRRLDRARRRPRRASAPRRAAPALGHRRVRTTASASASAAIGGVQVPGRRASGT